MAMTFERKMKIKEIQIKLTIKFNKLNEIYKKTQLKEDFYRCARLQRDIYHRGGHIYRYGDVYQVDFLGEV